MKPISEIRRTNNITRTLVCLNISINQSSRSSSSSTVHRTMRALATCSSVSIRRIRFIDLVRRSKARCSLNSSTKVLKMSCLSSLKASKLCRNTSKRGSCSAMTPHQMISRNSSRTSWAWRCHQSTWNRYLAIHVCHWLGLNHHMRALHQQTWVSPPKLPPTFLSHQQTRTWHPPIWISSRPICAAQTALLKISTSTIAISSLRNRVMMNQLKVSEMIMNAHL